MTRPKHSLRAFPLCALALALGCRPEPATADPQAAVTPNVDATWPEFASRFLDEYFAAHPAYAVVQGRHEHDGKLPDWSAEGIAREVDRLRAVRVEAEAFDPGGLDDTQRMERGIILARIDRDLFWLDDARWPFRNPFFYFDWMSDGLDPAVYVTREYAEPDVRLRAYVAYAENIPVAAAQIRENLSQPLPRSYIDFGTAGFGGLASYYETDVPRAFEGVGDAELRQRFTTANAGAVAAMRELAEHLEGKRADQTEAFALGPELFAGMVSATEGVDVDLATLERVGEADLQRNLDTLASTCRELIGDEPEQPIAKCIEVVAADKPEGGAVEGARAQLEALRPSMEALVTIPGTEVARVEEAPPYMRQNFAYIDIPGPYEKGLPSTYFISPPDPAWAPEVQAAYVPGRADLLFTSVHEVWPGHFLQYLHANRSRSEVARVFVGYAYSEGWAHYTEEMMCDEALCEGEPAVRVGQLLNALLRNVRYISAIGLHARGMSVAESERMFAERAHQDPGNAKQQAARGTYDPGYLNYTMGKLMILRLRADWVKARGLEPGPAAWKAFHDAFLSFGGPPVPLVREAMLGPDAGSAL